MDWSYDLTNLVEALGEIERYDVLQGVRGPVWSWRTLTSDRSDNVRKAVISTINYLLVRLLFGLPLQDYQNITVYRRALLQSLDLETDSAFTSPEMLLKAWWKGARFLEVPTRFVPRRQGQSKGTRVRFISAAVRDIITCWWRWIVLGQRTERGRGLVTHWQAAVPASSRESLTSGQ